MSRTRVTEEEARRLWERAAQLQEQARRQLEGQVDQPSAADGAAAAEFDLDHVRQAAIEAGIDAAFVDSAWTESQIGVRPAGAALDRRITAFLGREQRSLEVSKIIEAPAAEVLDAVLEVATSDRCRLQPLDWVGGDPLEGGVLVFKPSPHDYTTNIGKAAMWADFKELAFRFEDLGEGRTEVRVRCSLEHSRKLNFWVGVPLVGERPGLPGPLRVRAVLREGGDQRAPPAGRRARAHPVPPHSACPARRRWEGVGPRGLRREGGTGATRHREVHFLPRAGTDGARGIFLGP